MNLFFQIICLVSFGRLRTAFSLYFSVFKNSPRILTFIIKLVLCFLCVRHISLKAYMTNYTNQVRCVCGCSINWVKTFLDTTWTLIHLGFLLNTNTNTITLPEDKTSQVEIWVKKLLHQGSPLRMSFSALCAYSLAQFLLLGRPQPTTGLSKEHSFSL